MARKGRVEYAGAICHVMSRGNGGQAVFWDEEDRHRFLSLLGEVCVRQGWLIHADVLLDNHDHLLLETPEPNWVSGMKWFLGTYTQRFNARHKRRGHLFQGRYKAIVVEREDVLSGVSRYCGTLDNLIETDSCVVTHRNRIMKIARIKD